MVVFETPEALNQISDEALELCVAEALSKPGLERSRGTPLLSFVTKSVCRRIYKILSGLDAEKRDGLSLQKALARVVNDMMLGKLDVESLEHSGNRMAGAAVTKHGKKIVDAERAVRKARSEKGINSALEQLALLHRELYSCKWGATIPPSSAATPATVPQARRKTPEDLDREIIIHEQMQEIMRLKEQSSKRERERVDVAQVDAFLAREQADDALQQLKAALVATAAAAEEAAGELATEL
eukprot:6899158-Prymnesium_polylepis.1